MSLSKYGSTFVAECDFCGDDFDTGEDDFVSAVDSMKRNGWKVFKTGPDWNHKCRACAEGNSDDFDVVA